MTGLRNEWHGIGRLTKDVELRKTASDISVCNFSIAVDRPGTNKDNKITDFFDCTAWRQTAETICKYFRQGDPIGVVGCLQNDKYTDNNGNLRTKVEISVDSIEFLPRPKQRELNEQQEQPSQEQDAADPGFTAVETDELPF